MDRITDTCKNITLATTSLRPVKTVEFTESRSVKSLYRYMTDGGSHEMYTHQLQEYAVNNTVLDLD